MTLKTLKIISEWFLFNKNFQSYIYIFFTAAFKSDIFGSKNGTTKVLDFTKCLSLSHFSDTLSVFKIPDRWVNQGLSIKMHCLVELTNICPYKSQWTTMFHTNYCLAHILPKSGWRKYVTFLKILRFWYFSTQGSKCSFYETF